jgi:hypothetical protein
MRLLPAWLALIALLGVLGGGESRAAATCTVTQDAPAGPLEIRTEPAAGAEVLEAIQPGAAGELTRLDARATSDGDWLKVAHGAVTGWVSASLLACPLSPEAAREAVGPLVAKVLEAMRAHDMRALSTVVHPVHGVRFAPYAFLDKASDRRFTAAELRSAWDDPRTLVWGAYDGSGEPIRLSFADYFRKFVYDRDFAASAQLSFDGAPAVAGNTHDNAREEYPNAVIVQAHVPGADPELGGMDWRTLRLVFEQHDGAWRLVYVIHDQWTI